MRILTNSQHNPKGLISIIEAEDYAPQTVIFCIPIELHDAKNLQDIGDFEKYFAKGILTKIKNQDKTDIIHMDYVSPRRTSYRDKTHLLYYIFPRTNNEKFMQIPKFVANIKGHKVDFYLSLLNFVPEDLFRLKIDFYYSGNHLSADLFNKMLVIVEPNLQQLDKLYLEEKVLFTDWN